MTAPPPQSFQPGVAAVPATQVEISVSCRNLKDKDVFSKSDPMCVLYMQEFANNAFYEVGRTEMIRDTLHPEFVKKFLLNYYFEQSQKLKFELYDVDSTSARLEQHDFLGRLECTLGEIVGSPTNKLEKPLAGLPGKAGHITVRAEEVSNNKEIVTLHFQGKKLDKKDFFGKSDPFLVISRSNEDGSFTVVHRSEVIKNTLNPTWQPFTIRGRVLCNGDHDRIIKFDVYDWDSDGSSHDLIGVFQTNLRELTRGRSSANDYEVINPKKRAKKKNYKHSGMISLLDIKIEMEDTFLDFIQGGLQMNFTVAVDFTASNGDPNNPTSLHYMNPYQPNHYVSALQAVGGIIQDYDSDKMFPALGFGARLPPNGQVSHEFPLNGNQSNPFCNGIQGVVEAYNTSLRNVQLYGPTNFSPVINHVARFASSYQTGSHYFVLLIITDGVITDMAQTISAIISASSLPMSIIIVGVGDADFAGTMVVSSIDKLQQQDDYRTHQCKSQSWGKDVHLTEKAMEILDADDHRLQQGNRLAERDIVQFVPFREFVGGQYGQNLQVSQAHLAKEVLAEIPDQVLAYMKKKCVKAQRVGPGPATHPGGAGGENVPGSRASAPPVAAAGQQKMW